MEAPFYDNELKDEYSHEHVRSARAAGREWARREWDALSTEQRDEQRGQPWYGIAPDARPLVAFAPTSDVEDQHERAMELAHICNDAASDEWDVLASASDDAELVQS